MDLGQFNDPLTTVTRNVKRNLIMASSVGILVSFLGLVPTKVTALGISFNEGQQNHFIVILIALNLFQLLQFSIYMIADYFAWVCRFNVLNTDGKIIESEEYIIQQFHTHNGNKVIMKLLIILRRLNFGYIRLIWDSVLPIILGVFSSYWLWEKI